MKTHSKNGQVVNAMASGATMLVLCNSAPRPIVAANSAESNARWTRVGTHIRSAINRYDQQQKGKQGS